MKKLRSTLITQSCDGISKKYNLDTRRKVDDNLCDTIPEYTSTIIVRSIGL